jgi:hypothetical protein
MAHVHGASEIMQLDQCLPGNQCPRPRRFFSSTRRTPLFPYFLARGDVTSTIRWCRAYSDLARWSQDTFFIMGDITALNPQNWINPSPPTNLTHHLTAVLSASIQLYARGGMIFLCFDR